MHFWYLLTTNFIWKILISFPNGVDNATCMQRTLFYEATMSLVLRKPDFCICENKAADQLRGNREADQRLYFRYIDSTISLLS